MASTIGLGCVKCINIIIVIMSTYPNSIRVSIIIVFILIVADITSYDVQCPNPAQWELRAKGFCNASLPSYVCLLDDNNDRVVETCIKQPEFETPGYRLVVRGEYDGKKCDNDTYQPFKFWTERNSDCVFSKSTCEDEGQIYVDFGSTVSDVSCLCDFTKGYAFVTMPTNLSACHPANDDCSCYLKICEADMFLGRDYLCRKRHNEEKKNSYQMIKENRSNSDANERRTMIGGNLLQDTVTIYHGHHLVASSLLSAILTVFICGISLKVVEVKRLRCFHQNRITSRDRSDLICKKCSQKECALCFICKASLCKICKQHMDISGHSIVECAQLHCDLTLEKKNKVDKKVDGSPKEIRTTMVSKLTFQAMGYKPVLACGICILSDRCIVIADYNNQQLILFNDSNSVTKHKLYYKPRGMDSLSGNGIAITIAESKIIRIYNIILHGNNKKAYFREIYVISTSNFGEPYKIAYNDDHFVVEMWEKNQGVLVVYDSDGQIIKSINIATFNGEIRLCLQWASRLIFVSAINMKSVFCLDFEGNVMWERYVSSPRSIIYIPEARNEKLILAKSCSDALYCMDIEDGSYDIIRLPKRVTSPNFLAFHVEHNLLVIMGQKSIYTLTYKKSN